MKQIITSSTLLDKCLYAEIQNMQVPPKWLRNKKYKVLILSDVYSTGEIRSVNVKEEHTL